MDPVLNRFQMFHLQSLAMNVIQPRTAKNLIIQNVERMVVEQKDVYVWMDTKTVAISLLVSVSQKVRTFGFKLRCFVLALYIYIAKYKL